MSKKQYTWHPDQLKVNKTYRLRFVIENEQEPCFEIAKFLGMNNTGGVLHLDFECQGTNYVTPFRFSNIEHVEEVGSKI